MNKSINFGTDGIRGNSKKFPFTKKALISLGQSIAQWGISRYKKENLKKIIGHDTRISCKRIKKNLEIGLLNFSIKIYDAKILPTPAVCKLANYYNDFDFGIIISASHNPYKDNGIKLIDAKTGKLKPEDEQFITKKFQDNLNNVKLPSKGNITKHTEFKVKYIKIIKRLFKNNFLKNKKIILDCANGATYKIAPQIFKALGANVITINNKPSGKNINQNCGALHPEKLQLEVIKHKADAGFAFDGDGDRVIAVNNKGIIIDGDQIIALLTTNPSIKRCTTIVGIVMTNLGLDIFLKKTSTNLIRTKVGDKYVALKLQENNLILGGESSGHIIITNYLTSGDGIFTALKTIETAILTNNLEMISFKKFPQTLINVPIFQKKDLTTQPFAEIIKKHEKLLKDGRIIVRYSGTENVLRIMVEGEKEKKIKEIANSLSQGLQKALN